MKETREIKILILVTRYRPVTGAKSTEIRYLKLGPNFSVDRRVNQFVRTTVRLKPDSGDGSDIKVSFNPL